MYQVVKTHHSIWFTTQEMLKEFKDIEMYQLVKTHPSIWFTTQVEITFSRDTLPSNLLVTPLLLPVPNGLSFIGIVRLGQTILHQKLP